MYQLKPRRQQHRFVSVHCLKREKYKEEEAVS